MIGSAAWLALAIAVSAQVELSPRLQEWRAELNETGIRVLFARIYTDTDRNLLILPPDAPERPRFAGMLAQNAFVEQFVHAHALTVNLSGISLVFLNMRRAAEWEGHEEALLAHELAHIGLKARGYESVRATGLPPCQVIHATNIVQHVLVRRELRARGINEAPFRIRTLSPVLEASGDGQDVRSSECDRARRLELWIDVAIGLTDEQWAQRKRFLDLMEKKWPELAQPSARLSARLEKADLSDEKVYEETLTAVAAALQELE